MKCPGCGTEIPNPGKFCGVCGRPLEQKLCPNGHVLAPGAEACPICATTKHPVMPVPGEGGGGKAVGVHTPDKGKTLFEIGAWQDVADPAPAPAGGASIPIVTPPPASGDGDLLFETPGPGPAAEGRAGGPVPAEVPAQGGVRKTRLLGGEAPTPAAETLAGWLVGAIEQRGARDYRLMEGRNTIGASPKNQIVIDHDSVSSNHAAVICQCGTYFVEDNNSTNGTEVNGRRVSRSDLADGDALKFGTYALTFHPFRKRQA